MLYSSREMKPLKRQEEIPVFLLDNNNIVWYIIYMISPFSDDMNYYCLSKIAGLVPCFFAIDNNNTI